MSAKHYHVLAGQRGLYMPTANHVFTSLRDAQRFARDEAELARDDGEAVRKVPHDRYGFYEVGDDESIEVTDCNELSCLGELDG